MREKEEKKILEDLNKILVDKVLNGFKNRDNRIVEKIEHIQILDYKIDQDEKNRDQVLVSNFYALARVYVNFGIESSSSDNIVLKSQNPIKFIYNKKIDNFELSDDKLEFYDATNN